MTVIRYGTFKNREDSYGFIANIPYTNYSLACFLSHKSAWIGLYSIQYASRYGYVGRCDNVGDGY